MKTPCRIKTTFFVLIGLFSSSSLLAFQNAPTNGALKITEVVIASDPTNSYIEIQNQTQDELELSGIALKDNNQQVLYTFGSGSIAANGLLILTNAIDKFSFEQAWNNLDSNVLFHIATNNLNISNAQSWTLEGDSVIDQAVIGATGNRFVRDLSITNLLNSGAVAPASPGVADIVFNGSTDIAALNETTGNVNAFFNVDTALPDTQIAAINNMHIANGAKLTINGGLTVNGEATNEGQLIVSSDEDSSGSLIANNQLGDLELTYERYIGYSNAWASISSPVHGQTVGDFLETNDVLNHHSINNRKYFVKFNKNSEDTSFSSVWSYYNSNDQNIINHNEVWSSKSSYLAVKQSPGKYIFKGKLSNENQNIPLEVNNKNLGWNYIGNPYTSFISIDKLIDDNQSIFESNYAGIFIYSLVSNSWEPVSKANNSYISPGQAFLIKVKNSSVLTLKKSQTRNIISNCFGSPQPDNTNQNRIRLRINDGSFTRYAYLFHTSEGTNELNKGFDLGIMDSYEHFLNIYSYQIGNNENLKLSIQDLSKSNLENDYIIPIGLNVRENKTVNIKAFSNIENNEAFKDIEDIILEDRELNIFTSLTQNQNGYTFTNKNKIEGGSRFFIHVTKQKLNTEKVSSNSEIIYYKRKIKLNFNSKSTVELFDIYGKNHFTSTTLDNEILLPNYIKKGVYIIKIKSKNHNISKKIIID